MSAGFWAIGLRIALRLLVLVRTIILANLLSPDDFGLMAVATLTILLLDRFTQGGFDSALVQKEEAIEPYLNSAWTLQVLRGAVMAIALVLLAPLIALFFQAPESETIIRVLAIAIFIKGFTNIAVIYFVKELRFGGYFLLEISDKGFDILVSITAAIALRNVWALVFGVIAGAIGRTVTSYIIQKYRPRLEWEWDRIKDLFNFGKWILWSNMLTYLTGNIDDIVVGRIAGLTDLGLYRMAYNLSQSMATEITQVVGQVAFPTYSQLQDSIVRLRKAYFGSVHLVAFTGLPLAIGTILIAPDVTIGLLGDKWAPMVLALRLLSIAGLARGLGATIGPLFQSQGKPNIPPRFSIAKLIMLGIGLYPMVTLWGMNGAAVLVAVTALTTGVAAIYVAFRFVGGAQSQTLQTLGWPAINTAFMSVVVLGARTLPIPQPTAISFVVLSIIGAVAYFASVGVTMRYAGYHAPADLIAKVRQAAA
jgi:O-antigen/teichoic acid export membrane protein